MPVQYIFDSSEKSLRISITGNFNFDLHSEFRESYRNITPGSARKVLVDLKNTTYMDSSALGMLLLLDEHFPSIKIQLLNCSDYIRKVLEISNFHLKFSIS